MEHRLPANKITAGRTDRVLAPGLSCKPQTIAVFQIRDVQKGFINNLSVTAKKYAAGTIHLPSTLGKHRPVANLPHESFSRHDMLAGWGHHERLQYSFVNTTPER